MPGLWAHPDSKDLPCLARRRPEREAVSAAAAGPVSQERLTIMKTETGVEPKCPGAPGGREMASQKLRIGIVRQLAARLLQELIPLEDAREDDPHSPLSFYDEVRRFEIGLLVSALARTRGNQYKAARLLGLKATTLHSKLKLYNISTKIYGVPQAGRRGK
jgi:DNA-binding NtrC family response regulator